MRQRRFKLNRFCHVLCSVFVLFALMSACGLPTPHSKGREPLADTATVKLPLSPVKNQGNVGFCWSYAILGLIESVHAKESGRILDLSEEALAFHYMVESLHGLLQADKPIEHLLGFLLYHLPGLFIEGNLVDAPAEARDLRLVQGLVNRPDALSLLYTYGIVPERVWSFKPPQGTEARAFIERIKNNFGGLVRESFRSKRALHSISKEEIIEKVLVGPGVFPSAPPGEFQFRGHHYTARSLLSAVFPYPRDSLRTLSAKGEADYSAFIQKIKVSLAQGYPAIVHLPFHPSMLKGDRFQATSERNFLKLLLSGYSNHAMLITDFVNLGGQLGEVTQDELAGALKEEPEALEFLVAKNSWGTLLPSAGSAPSSTWSSAPGYYLLMKDYLKQAVASGQWTPGLVSVTTLEPSTR